MNLTELKDILEATGYPVAYSHFTDPVPDLPYVVYLETYSSNFKADNTVFKNIRNVQIELYTKKKDIFAEAKVETVLSENEIAYETTETFVESEEIFQKIYEVRLI